MHVANTFATIRFIEIVSIRDTEFFERERPDQT